MCYVTDTFGHSAILVDFSVKNAFCWPRKWRQGGKPLSEAITCSHTRESRKEYSSSTGIKVGFGIEGRLLEAFGRAHSDADCGDLVSLPLKRISDRFNGCGTSSGSIEIRKAFS